MNRSWNLRPPANILAIFKISLFFLLVYQFLRGCFLFFNTHRFIGVEWQELVFSFLHGTRFDIYSIFWLNAPLFLALLFLPLGWQHSKIFKRCALAWLFLVNCFFIGFNVSDWEMINFAGKRTTMDIFFIAGEIGSTGWDIVTFYWFQTLLGVSVIAFVFFYVRKLVSHYQPIDLAGQRVRQGVWTGMTLVLVFLGMRGGLQLKPIRPVNAYVGVSQAAGALVLNTTFTMLRSKSSGEFKTVHFFRGSEDVRQTLMDGREISDTQRAGSLTGFNVVLIILESFSQEYTGLSELELPTYTPFLDELARSSKARAFTNHFANGRRSIDAVPSLLAGIPTLMSEPFISSNFQTNRIVGWGEVLREMGYETAFFHGAKNGSMFFDSFSAQAGFSNYYGLSEYTGSDADNDGSWGVYDEPFFRFTVDQLSKGSKPFAAVLFSLSSHHPYNIPGNLKGQFPKGDLDIHESIGYTDYSLKRFFEEAQKTDWFENTLFIITADHTSKSLHPASQTLYGAHRVPLILYSPGKSLPPHPGQVFTQHVDVPKTIYHLIGVEPPMTTLFGSDIFALSENGYKGEVYNFSYPGYWYLSGQGLFHFDDSGQVLSKEAVEGWHKSSQIIETTTEWSVTRMKAWLQYYNNGLIQNQWFTRVDQHQ